MLVAFSLSDIEDFGFKNVVNKSFQIFGILEFLETWQAVSSHSMFVFTF